MRSMSTTSALSFSIASASPSKRANCSFMRVSGVRRSWLTPASISVRWSTWRLMRSRMRKKAAAAWRTSVAPAGFSSSVPTPLPKLSAASARRRIGRIWLRKKTMAMASRISEAPTIHMTKI